MRVISGAARGRKLKEPMGADIRPTTDMVKESIFNIIQFDIEGRDVLDLFAGTGQLGIEALSRGARHCEFVDESNASLQVVRENLRHTKLDGSASVVRSDSIAFLKRAGKYNIIFLDPPYESEILRKALKNINEFDILKENGIIVCESRLDYEMPELEPPYMKRKEYKYGKIKITIYDKNS